MSNTHFGIFHLEPGLHPEAFQESLSQDYLDSYIIDCMDEELCINTVRACCDVGKQCWIIVTELFELSSVTPVVDVGESREDTAPRPVARLKDDWRAKIDRLFDRLLEEGIWEGFSGLYLDEPFLWGATLDDLEELTRYARERHPDKGFFICFSVAGVAPDIWSPGYTQPITAKAGRYLTDVAFDMYHSFDDQYRYAAEEMKRRLGNRDDLRVWYIPCTMDYRGDKDEQHCLDHLYGCYDLLKQEKNPGGLFCFTYHTFPREVEALGNVGLVDLCRPDYPKYWPTLINEMKRIGREILRNDD